MYVSSYVYVYVDASVSVHVYVFAHVYISLYLYSRIRKTKNNLSSAQNSADTLLFLCVFIGVHPTPEHETNNRKATDPEERMPCFFLPSFILHVFRF